MLEATTAAAAVAGILTPAGFTETSTELPFTEYWTRTVENAGRETELRFYVRPDGRGVALAFRDGRTIADVVGDPLALAAELVATATALAA